MDFNLIIAIAIVAVGVYLFIKLVISPLFKAILGIIVFASLIYILQNYFNVDFKNIFDTVIAFLSQWEAFRQIENYIQNIIAFINKILANIPK